MKKFKKIYVEITNICNRNCSFCSTDHRIKKEMTPFKFEEVLKKIRPHTNYIYLHVKGEPLIHSQLDILLTLCDQYQMNVNITTNGTRVKESLPILMEHPCLRQLNISLHSFESGMEEYIHNIFNSIDQLLEHRNTIVVYRFWALPDHQLSMENKNIVKEIVSHYGISKEIEEKIYTDKNISLDQTLYLNKAPLFEWPSLSQKEVGCTGFCHGLTRQIGILVDGTVIPCCLDSEGLISLGNIFEQSLEKIIESERCQSIVNHFRDGKVIEPLCQHCSYRLRFSPKRNIIKKDKGITSNE